MIHMLDLYLLIEPISSLWKCKTKLAFLGTEIFAAFHAVQCYHMYAFMYVYTHENVKTFPFLTLIAVGGNDDCLSCLVTA